MTDMPIDLAAVRAERDRAAPSTDYTGPFTRRRAEILANIMRNHGLKLPEETAVRLMTALLVDERMDALGIVHEPIRTWPDRVNRAWEGAVEEGDDRMGEPA